MGRDTPYPGAKSSGGANHPAPRIAKMNRFIISPADHGCQGAGITFVQGGAFVARTKRDARG